MSNKIAKILKILVVEDDNTSRELLRRILLEKGTVDAASNGVDAIAYFKESIEKNEHYDLICLDIEMPKASGHEVLTFVRNMEKENGIEGIFKTKVIMTTASHGEEDVVNAFMGECDAYILKPVNKTILFERMREIGLIKNTD
ncbi:response regulator [Myxococcota bacterium]|nr:response regulator [Myxococcota bacterium]MBU1379984.1 response regulator [Myxococcota bacterium]MBU1498476.1 response regulator [Myxococcota bacterium]